MRSSSPSSRQPFVSRYAAFTTLFCSLVTTSLASFCGKSGVPYSFEVLPSGAPVLGCAQPSCVMTAEVAAEQSETALPEFIEDSEFFTDVNGQADGFFRDGDRALRRYRHGSAPKLIANCSGSFNELSCPRKNQWVGGIEYIDHPRQPLILQCCSFDGLRFSQEVGSTIVGPGEAITGGEVIRAGRQISFDVIANVKKVTRSAGARRISGFPKSVSYEVTVRRMNCLPDPPEPEVEFDNDVPVEVLKVLSTASNKDLGTVERLEKKFVGGVQKSGKGSKPKQHAAPTEQLPEVSDATDSAASNSVANENQNQLPVVSSNDNKQQTQPASNQQLTQAAIAPRPKNNEVVMAPLEPPYQPPPTQQPPPQQPQQPFYAPQQPPQQPQPYLPTAAPPTTLGNFMQTLFPALFPALGGADGAVTPHPLAQLFAGFGAEPTTPAQSPFAAFAAPSMQAAQQPNQLGGNPAATGGGGLVPFGFGQPLGLQQQTDQSLPQLVQPPSPSSINAQFQQGIPSQTVVQQQPQQGGQQGIYTQSPNSAQSQQPAANPQPQQPQQPTGKYQQYPQYQQALQQQQPQPLIPPAPKMPPAMGTILQAMKNYHPITVPGLGVIGYSNINQ